MTTLLSRRALISSSALAASSALLPALKSAAAPPDAPAGRAEIAFRPLELKLTHTWTIARGSSDEKKNGLLTLTAEGVTGYGEAAANKRWNQSYDTAEAAFRRVKPAVEGLSPWEHLAWLERAEKEAGADTEVVAALDMALWDWKGKRLSRPVHQLLGVSGSRMPVTTFSIGIDTADVMKQKTREAAAFPRLKVKIGLPNDEENIAAIRSVTDKPITVDANEGWKTVEETKKKLEWLNGVKPVYLEQPMPAAMDPEMARLKGIASYPILADEGILHPSDIPSRAVLFDGIVVKLQKAGGITRAWEQIAVARALSMKLMCGCMIESSLGIAAALALAPLFDWLDLDGNLLVSNDPWKGLTIRHGRWELPSGPGLGVVPVSV